MTPIKVGVLRQLLNEAQYNHEETDFLCKGFTDGFDLRYRGPMDRRDTADNIPFTVGDKYQLWEKMMTEIEAKHFAGPFKLTDLPVENFVQSPIGLVPKSGNKTRLIFHLSYKFKNVNKSINFYTPVKLASVKYNDLDKAIRDCIQLMEELGISVIFFSKSDLKNAFRVLPLLLAHHSLLVMKAQHPETGVWYYFIDMCLPFGASISCAHFQQFSNGLKAIVEHRANKILRTLITNYLDDFLFIYVTQNGCNEIVMIFLRTCQDINFPVSHNKTEWASPLMVFLGMLLDGRSQTLSIPVDKRLEALNMVHLFQDKCKAKVKNLQKLTGHLNFINRAVVPGRVFTRRMYAKFSGSKFDKLKQYHHIQIDKEFRHDCAMWERFLEDINSVTWPFIDMKETLDAQSINFFSDALANENLGFGAIFENQWIFGK